MLGYTAGGSLIFYTFTTYMQKYLVNTAHMNDRTANIVMTAVLVFNVISTTRREYSTAIGGLHVGLTLALIHLVSIPVDNTSVNPVRSFAVAIFAGGDALEQLWAFIVFPLVGGAVGWLAHRAVSDESLGVPAGT